MEALKRPWLFAGSVAICLGYTEVALAQNVAQQGASKAATLPLSSDAAPTGGSAVSGTSGEPSVDSLSDANRSPEQLREARERFDHGLELYRDGDYEIALIEFNRAYELVPDHRVLYNIAQVSVMLGSYARARLALEQYLREGDTAISPERREAVEKDLVMLNGRTATLRVTCNLGGAEVLVGEELVGKTPMSTAVLLDAGTHTITVRLSGYLPASQRLILAGRDAVEIALELRPMPVKERERIVVEKRVEAVPKERTTATPSLLWAGWIATGAFATGAAVTGVLGLNAAGELKNLQNDPEAKHRELEDTGNRATSLFLAADLLGAAALLTGGATLYFAFFHPTTEQPQDHDRRASMPAIGLSAQGVKVSGRF